MMWCVQHWSKNYGKTYGCNYGEMFFDDEQSAVSLCEKINNGDNGRGVVITKEWTEKELPLIQFPLKMGLPIIVSRK